MDSPVEFYDFWYINSQKVDSLFAQLQGYVESEWKQQTSKGSSATGKAALQLGSILATLGLGKASLEGEIKGDYSKLLEVTRSLADVNKIHVLLEYQRKNDSLAQVRLQSSTREEVIASLKQSPFALVMGYFNYDDRLMKSDPVSAVPAQVPTLEGNVLLNQAINAMSEEDYFGHNIFATTVPRPEYLLINPIAIWFAHAWEDAPENQWGIPSVPGTSSQES